MSGKIYVICFVFFFHFRLASSLSLALSVFFIFSHWCFFNSMHTISCTRLLSFACRKLLVLSPKTLDEYSNVSPFNLTGACGDDLLDDGFWYDCMHESSIIRNVGGCATFYTIRCNVIAIRYQNTKIPTCKFYSNSNNQPQRYATTMVTTTTDATQTSAADQMNDFNS